MKRQTRILAGVLITCVLSSGAASAYAGGRYHGGGHFHGGHHHHSGARVGVGVSFGIPFGAYYAPYYYPPAYYYGPGYYHSAPVVVAPASPPVYIERGADGTPVLPPQASQQYPSGYWYYCSNPQGYYPYVKECAGGWQQVSPQPPQQ